MRRQGLLLAAGIVAFLLFLGAFAPATLLLRWLPTGLWVEGLQGTLWSGRAARAGVGAAPGVVLGTLRWRCRPWALLGGRWSCHLHASPAGGDLQARIGGDFGSIVTLTRLAGSLPLVLLHGSVVPPGWTGRVDLSLEELRLVDGWPVEAGGAAILRALRAPGPAGAELGDFELQLGEGAVGSPALAGRIRDLGGPLQLRATLELRADRSYLLSGEVAPGPGAGPAIMDTLGFLGPPDSLGRRPFGVEGTL